MHRHDVKAWQHEHIFEQDREGEAERRTVLVIGITAVMMAVEITTGLLSGSMALLADGMHMASHTAALGINVFAYRYARRHARDPRFSFGTGKVNALGGYSGAVLLGVFALIMGFESLHRLVDPVAIEFSQAIAVAVIGLVVNGVSMFLLKGEAHHGHDHDHGHGHGHDHNLRAAYLHVLADALTSLLAIAALLSAKYFGAVWMDPLMGLAGTALVSRWSFGLLRDTSRTLLDHQGPREIEDRIVEAIEADGDSRVTDLHLWAIGPSFYSAAISLVAVNPGTPADYKKSLEGLKRLAHVTIEVNICSGGSEEGKKD